MRKRPSGNTAAVKICSGKALDLLEVGLPGWDYVVNLTGKLFLLEKFV
jgi:hypothetical protein